VEGVLMSRVGTNIGGVVIGVGAPNRTKDDRVVQCAIVIDEAVGLTRVFCDYRNGMDRLSLWDRCEILAQATPKDSRFESWKMLEVDIAGKVESSQEKRAILEACVRETGDEDPIDLFNRERRSIAVVKPQQSNIGYGMEIRDFDESPDWITTQCETPQKPFLQWQSKQGKQHCQQIAAHEVYEWLRKNPSKHGCLWDNLQITNIDFDKWLLIGTASTHRTSWLVVHVHRLKKTTQPLIDSSSLIVDGKPEGWPYSTLADVAAKRAESTGQQLLFTT
jgi:hypothetical protein